MMNAYRHSQGATLATSLVLLLLLTLLGTAAMQTSAIEEKMYNNIRDKEHSFHASESALEEAEDWLIAKIVIEEPVPSCTTQPCIIDYDSTTYYEAQDSGWWAANSAGFSGGTLSNIKTQPRYIVGFHRFVPDTITIGKGGTDGTYFYQITTRGTGATDIGVSVLQTTVAKRY